ncbi:MAG: lysylphosphatidylglycerol synthase transmembrane domain-containing protein [Cyanobacteria bacterium J06649_5]
MPDSAQPSSAKRKNKLLFFVKLAITAAICTIVVSSVDWQSIFLTIQNSNKVLLSSVFVLIVLSVTISAYKWKVILSIHGIDFSFNNLHKWYFVAMFLNNLLPSTIGGDGYRILKTIDNPKSKSSAVIAIFVERLTGLMALLLLGYIGAVVSFLRGQDEFSRAIALSGTLILVLLIPTIYLSYRFNILRSFINSDRCPTKIKSLLNNIEPYGAHPGKTAWVLLVSLFFQIHSIFFNWLLIVSLGKALDFFRLAVVVMMTNAIAVLPISINGLGLTEGSFMYFTGLYGLDNETALLSALILRVLIIPISLIGGLIYLRQDRTEAIADR